MAEALKTHAVPLLRGDDGVIRVAGTRVTLDSVHHAFQSGATAEEIAQQFPTLGLAEIYQVIGYLLQYSADVQDYLNLRQSQALAARTVNETKWAPTGIRERLLGRRRG